MFESIRNHQRWLMAILLLLIFPSFVLFGLDSYTQFMRDDQAIAKVAGTSITAPELENEVRNRIDQLRQQFGASFDPRLVDTPETRKIMLDQLVDQRVLQAQAKQSHLIASDQLLRDTIQAFPEVQKDGKFDYQTYQSLLAARGSNEQIFEERMRADLAQNRISASVSNSSLLPKKLLDRLIIDKEQTVQVQEKLFKKEDFFSQIVVDEVALKKFYEDNKKLFEAPEKITAEYVRLSAQDLSTNLVISPDEIKKFYTDNTAKYGVQEQRRASHILINANKDAKEADKQAAYQQANAILAQLKADPSSFARLAKEKSQDLGSGQKGGDLDFFAKGMMVKPFEDAVFAMQQGELSGIVQSDFGYHIITLTGIKPAGTRPLDAVSAEIETELRKTKAAKLFTDSAESFSNLVYEQADSFKSVQEKFKLTAQKAEGLSRSQFAAGAQPQAGLPPKVIEALFSQDAISSRKNTAAIDVGANNLVSARVTDYQPARIPTFEQIRAQVQLDFMQREAGKKVVAAGQQALAKLTANLAAPEAAGFTPSKTVSISNPAGLSPAALRLIKQGAAGLKLPAVVGGELENGQYAIYQLTALGAVPVVDEAKRSEFLQANARLLIEQEERGVLADLRVQHKAKIIKTSFAVADANTAAAVPSPAK